MLGTYLQDKVFSYILSERTLHYLEQNQKSFQLPTQRAIQRRIDEIKLDTELYPDNQLRKYCCQEKVISIRKLEINYPDQFNFDWGLYGACQGGHQDLVELMIQKSTDFNLGLHGACQGGHRDLVELMIEKGATNLDLGLHGACQGGHRDLVELMIEKGANHFRLGLYGACQGGHQDLVILMIEKGATDSCLFRACLGGTSCYCGKSIAEHLEI